MKYNVFIHSCMGRLALIGMATCLHDGYRREVFNKCHNSTSTALDHYSNYHTFIKKICILYNDNIWPLIYVIQRSSNVVNLLLAVSQNSSFKSLD